MAHQQVAGRAGQQVQRNHRPHRGGRQAGRFGKEEGKQQFTGLPEQALAEMGSGIGQRGLAIAAKQHARLSLQGHPPYPPFPITPPPPASAAAWAAWAAWAAVMMA